MKCVRYLSSWIRKNTTRVARAKGALYSAVKCQWWVGRKGGMRSAGWEEEGSEGCLQDASRAYGPWVYDTAARMHSGCAGRVDIGQARKQHAPQRTAGGNRPDRLAAWPSRTDGGRTRRHTPTSGASLHPGRPPTETATGSRGCVPGKADCASVRGLRPHRSQRKPPVAHRIRLTRNSRRRAHDGRRH